MKSIYVLTMLESTRYETDNNPHYFSSKRLAMRYYNAVSRDCDVDNLPGYLLEAARLNPERP